MTQQSDRKLITQVLQCHLYTFNTAGYQFSGAFITFAKNSRCFLAFIHQTLDSIKYTESPSVNRAIFSSFLFLLFEANETRSKGSEDTAAATAAAIIKHMYE